MVLYLCQAWCKCSAVHNCVKRLVHTDMHSGPTWGKTWLVCQSFCKQRRQAIPACLLDNLVWADTNCNIHSNLPDADPSHFTETNTGHKRSKYTLSRVLFLVGDVNAKPLVQHVQGTGDWCCSLQLQLLNKRKYVIKDNIVGSQATTFFWLCCHLPGKRPRPKLAVHTP